MSTAEFIAAYEGALRIAAFAVVFGFMALWEWIAPARHGLFRKLRRWSHNLALLALDVIVVRLLFPAAAIGVALLAEANGAGLLRVWDLPVWLAVLAGVVLLDLSIYLQHLLFHAVPVLWRVHRVHHADPDFDITTGLRFHPIEIVLSMLIKGAAIFAFGPPVIAVLIFEVLLNALAVFNHANVHLPARLEKNRAPVHRHAGHAPRAPLEDRARDQQQLRFQPFGLGPHLRHLPGPARIGARTHAYRRVRAGRCEIVGQAGWNAVVAVHACAEGAETDRRRP
jgi:sterol desaturase/sphingolipid hydroxylase (fatty acid hydroxylase superfamily)